MKKIKLLVFFLISIILISCTNEIIANKDDSFDMIQDHLWDKLEYELSPYYEILSYEISNYKEKNYKKYVDTSFNYKITYKNYDRDPDTVSYVKEAKEVGSSNYDLLYNTYLDEKVKEFKIKATIDKYETISIYYRPNEDEDFEWKELNIFEVVENS